LASPEDIIIGRADPGSGFVPAVDLSPEGEVAVRVSRRHARIIWRNHLPYLQDLTSTFGTRLGGNRLLPEQLVPLKPGDHMSLGGCVLAYDIET
jgi:pSer/pThr/pTyr-binding forkhead associated (FHA) protein